MMRAAAVALIGLAALAVAEIPETTGAGIPLFRRDVSAIQILVNGSIKAGATNADGRVIITPASDPVKAIDAAGAEWSGIASALINFLPSQPTALSNDPKDGKFVLTIEDTAANRSVVGSFLAITLYRFSADGTITDSDIVFNPSVVQGGTLYPFSTNHAAGTYDLQSLVAHELGHSLGSTHSPVICATMFQSQGAFSQFISAAEATVHQALSADDIAFATARYPAPDVQVGSISGEVAFSSGNPVVGALVVAINPATGTMIGALSSLSDGSFRMDAVPPGTYNIYAQPANGPVATANISGVPNAGKANTTFRTTFAGGNATPSAIAVMAGQTSSASISVDPAQPLLHIDYLGTGSAGGSDWAYIVGVKGSPGGRATDVLFWGQGLGAVTADQIRLIGSGTTLRPTTLHTQNTSNGPALRFTVDLPTVTANTPVAIAIVNGTDAAVFSGGFVIFGSGSGCTYAVSSKQVSIPAAGGSGSVDVTAGSGCAWMATSGSSWLKISSVTATSGNGTVAFAADPNPNAGSRSANLTVAGQTVTVIEAGASSGKAPAVTSVVNGASFLPGIESGSWVTIQGTNLANTAPGRTWRPDEIVGGNLPTSLDGVSVTIDGKAAFVYYISPTQINVQAPAGTATGSVNVVVNNNGATSPPASAQLQAFAPAFFLAGSRSYAIATRYPDNALVANPAAIPGAVAAAPRDVLILWGTGFGPTNPAASAGHVVTGASTVTTLPSVTVGGVAAHVIGGALSPGSVGLYQIAIQLPSQLPSGDIAVQASVAGVKSTGGVNIFGK